MFIVININTFANENKYNINIKCDIDTTFNIYKIGELNNKNEFIKVDTFEKCEIDFNNLSKTSIYINTFIKENSIKGIECVSNNDLYLETGWYMIIGNNIENKDTKILFLPTFINIKENTIITPKYEKQPIIITTTPTITSTPTPTKEPNIPQTGFIEWPLYYLFALGILFIILFFVTKHKKIMLFMTIFILFFTLGLCSNNRYEENIANETINNINKIVNEQIIENEKQSKTNEDEIYKDFDIYNTIEDKKMETIIIDDIEYIGMIKIPQLNLELSIINEWSYDNLKLSPNRFTGSIYTNDLIIAGHNYKKHFAPIRQLKVGETIYFVDINNKYYEYEIIEIEILNKNDIDKLMEYKCDLTLFTCTNGGKDRHTIRCNRK